MKKFLALLLALIMCVTVLASCGGDATTTDTESETNATETDAPATLNDAKTLLQSMMKDKNGKATPNDYDVVGTLKVGKTSFEVTWATDNANIKVKESSKAGYWTIDVPEVNETEVEYKLTATIKNSEGETTEITFTPKLPVVDNAGIATEFAEGVPYTMFMKQMTVGYTVYALNKSEQNNKYVSTTLDPAEAAVFYVEIVEGGYKIYTEVDGVKNYLHAALEAKEDGKVSKYLGFATETTCVFSYDKTLGVFTVVLEGTKYGVGSYQSYETISISEATYFTAEKIGVVGGQYPMGLMTKDHTDTLKPSEKPTYNDPAADSTLTIAEANTLGLTRNSGMYTDVKYYVTGEITKIESPDSYGNITIKDATGATFYIYGTYDSTGATKFGSLETKPAVGDTITVYGIIGNYNGTAQMKNGWIQGAEGGNGDNGDTPVVPSVNTELVEAPVVGTAYKFGVVQGNKDNKKFFINGNMANTYYFGSTENAAEAVDVFMEETTGGYYLYCMKGETKTYINITVSGTHINAVYEAAASTVYTFDATAKTLVTDIVCADKAEKSGQYCLGTYGTYTTISPVLMTTEYFACQFYAVVEGEGGESPVDPVPPVEDACTDHVDNDGDYKCDTENCGVLTGVPAAGTELTISQANALGVAHAHNTYTEGTYAVKGEIIEVTKPQYGEMKIKDADGNELVVYNSKAADGTAYTALSIKYIAGDKVTVYGIIGQFSGTAQIKNGLVTVTEQHAHEYTDGACACGATDPEYVPTHTCADNDGNFVCDETDCDKVVLPAANSVLTVKQALALGALFDNDSYTTDKYYVTGVITTVPNATHGNLDLTDGESTIYIYGLWDATGTNKYGNMTDKPVKGDTITVYTAIGKYSDKAQMKNAWVTEHTAHECDYTDATCEAPKTCKLCGVTDGEALEHNYVDGTCTGCGASESVADVNTATLSFADKADRTTFLDAIQVWSQNGITFTNNKHNYNNKLGDYANPIRLYAGTETIVSFESNITSIVFECNNASYATALGTSLSNSGYTAVVDGSNVTITFTEATTSVTFVASAQIRINQLTISYVAA